VTICIAAIASGNPGQDPHIVTVSDTMISGGIISADSTVLKIEPFHKDWLAMMAGDRQVPHPRHWLTLGRLVGASLVVQSRRHDLKENSRPD